MNQPLTEAAVALSELADWWAELTADRLPGTTRRWTEGAQDRDSTGRLVPLPADPHCPVCRTERHRLLSCPNGCVAQAFDRFTDLGTIAAKTCPTCDTERVLVLSCRRGCTTTAGAAHAAAPVRLDIIDVLADLSPAVLDLEAAIRRHLGAPVDATVEVPESDADDHLFRRPDRSDRATGQRPAGEEDRRVTAATYDRPEQFYDDDGHAASGYAPGSWTTARSESNDIDPRVPDALRWLSLNAHRIHNGDIERKLIKEAGRMARAARRALGTAEQAQRLKSPCPLCGCMSLVAFLERCHRNGWKRCEDLHCAEPEKHGVIYCTANEHDEQPICECERSTCSCHDGGRHRWTADEWRRLGLVLKSA